MPCRLTVIALAVVFAGLWTGTAGAAPAWNVSGALVPADDGGGAYPVAGPSGTGAVVQNRGVALFNGSSWRLMYRGPSDSAFFGYRDAAFLDASTLVLAGYRGIHETDVTTGTVTEKVGYYPGCAAPVRVFTDQAGHAAANCNGAMWWRSDSGTWTNSGTLTLAGAPAALDANSRLFVARANGNLDRCTSSGCTTLAQATLTGSSTPLNIALMSDGGAIGLWTDTSGLKVLAVSGSGTVRRDTLAGQWRSAGASSAGEIMVASDTTSQTVIVRAWTPRTSSWSAPESLSVATSAGDNVTVHPLLVNSDGDAFIGFCDCVPHGASYPATGSTYGWYRIGAGPWTTSTTASGYPGNQSALATSGNVVLAPIVGNSSSTYLTGAAGDLSPTQPAPRFVTGPTISGIPRVDAIITVITGTVSPSDAVTTISWETAASPTGPWATAPSSSSTSTYSPPSSAAGQYLRATVSTSNSGGTTTESTAILGQIDETPALASNPNLTGTARRGYALSCALPVATGWPTPSVSRTWLRGATTISGETGLTYTAQVEDVGYSITCRATASNSAGTVSTTSTSAGVESEPVPSGAVSLTTTLIGTTTSCGPTGWLVAPTSTSTTFSLDGTPVSSASTLLLPETWIGHLLSCEMVGTNLTGSTGTLTSAQSTITGPGTTPLGWARPPNGTELSTQPVSGAPAPPLPTFTGVLSPGRSVSCDAPGGSAWSSLRTTVAINGQSSGSSTFTVPSGGSTVVCRIRWAAGVALFETSVSTTVLALTTNPRIVSNPTVSGGSYVGASATCNLPVVSRNGRVQYQFRWLRNGIPIPRARAQVYTMQAADRGALVSCRTIVSNGDWSTTADSATFIALRTSTLSTPALVSADRGRDMRPRILGGGPVGKSTVPFLVYLNMGCTGSLIAPDVVVTAAHCVVDTRGNLIRVASIRVFHGSPTWPLGASARASGVSVHPKNNPRMTANDIAVIFLKSTFPGPYATLPTRPLVGGARASVAGWGIDESSHQPVNAKIANVRMMPKSKCLGILSVARWGRLPAGGICVEPFSTTHTATCFGDSGGPLFVGRTLYGVTSTGGPGPYYGKTASTCRASEADIYADVYRFSSWILSTSGLDAPYVSGQFVAGKTVACTRPFIAQSGRIQWEDSRGRVFGYESKLAITGKLSGLELRCVVIANGNRYYSEFGDTIRGAPVYSDGATITGSLKVGSTATCSSGRWWGSPYTEQQWWASGQIIGIGRTITIYQSVLDELIVCRIVATNDEGSTQIDIAAGSVVDIDLPTIPNPTLSSGGTCSGPFLGTTTRFNLSFGTDGFIADATGTTPACRYKQSTNAGDVIIEVM